MAGTMRALIKEEPVVGYELKEIAVPKVGRDEVLFRVEKVAICGSDIALHLWNDVAKVIATLPFIPGIRKYSFSPQFTESCTSSETPAFLY